DDYAFEKRMRIAFHFVAVHKGAGVALVGIADEVFGVGLGLGQVVPLVGGEEARAAAATEARGLHLLNYCLGASVNEHLVKCLVAANADVLFDIGGDDKTAI